jgi:hypothetical protein
MSKQQAMRVLTSNNNDEWYTPPSLVNLARDVMGGIDLDPASNATAQAWIQAGEYYDATHILSGLARPWYGRAFLNPPFTDTPSWADRFCTAAITGEIREGVLLVNSAPGYVWWERLLDVLPVVMLRERVRFVRPDGTVGGQAKKGQTVAYHGPNLDRFVAVFGAIGRYIPYGA